MVALLRGHRILSQSHFPLRQFPFQGFIQLSIPSHLHVRNLVITRGVTFLCDSVTSAKACFPLIELGNFAYSVHKQASPHERSCSDAICTMLSSLFLVVGLLAPVLIIASADAVVCQYFVFVDQPVAANLLCGLESAAERLWAESGGSRSCLSAYSLSGIIPIVINLLSMFSLARVNSDTRQ